MTGCQEQEKHRTNYVIYAVGRLLIHEAQQKQAWEHRTTVYYIQGSVTLAADVLHRRDRRSLRIGNTDYFNPF